MKCNNCSNELNEDKDRTIYGTARVDGVTSIKEFKTHGVEWISRESSDEYVICEVCNKPTSIWAD